MDRCDSDGDEIRGTKKTQTRIWITSHILNRIFNFILLQVFFSFCAEDREITERIIHCKTKQASRAPIHRTVTRLIWSKNDNKKSWQNRLQSAARACVRPRYHDRAHGIIAGRRLIWQGQKHYSKKLAQKRCMNIMQ